MVDTDGCPLVLRAHLASVQGRDGTVPLLKASRRGFAFVQPVFADSAYAAERAADATCTARSSANLPFKWASLSIRAAG